MITFQITAHIKDDRQVLVHLPPEVPIGQAELVISVDAAPGDAESRLDWVEVQARSAVADHDPYPLRGSVVRYEQPTEPVAEEDWEALR